MVFKGLIAAVSAVALAVTPTVASAQAAAASSAASEIAPATESVEGSELRGGFIIPLIAIVAIILGILAWQNDGDDELPKTP